MRILVIDDDQFMRECVAIFLADLGAEVDTASDGIKGLEAFNANGGYDLVFTDRTMPGMYGEEVVREIKRLSPKTFVAMMSGDEQEEVKRVGFAAGADKVLFKPFKFEELEDAIKGIVILK